MPCNCKNKGTGSTNVFQVKTPSGAVRSFSTKSDADAYVARSGGTKLY